MLLFKSKVDVWLAGVLALSVLLCFAVSVEISLSKTTAGILISFFVLVIGVALPLWILLGTYYLVSDDLLKIRSGPFSWAIPIESIVSVKETKNPLSSPALSLDRLRIDFQGSRSVMVSPKDKQEFLRAIDKTSI